MNLALIFDVVLIAVIVISAFVMSGKGLLKVLYKITSIIITIIVVSSSSATVSALIESSPVGERINEVVEAYVIAENTHDDTDSLSVMPEYINETITDIKTTTVAPAISNVVISILSAVCIYILVKLILYVLFCFIKGLFKLPILKQVNRLAGVCVGVLSGLVIVYIACAVLSLNISDGDEIRTVIDSTYLVKYFYDNNLLMSLFI